MADLKPCIEVPFVRRDRLLCSVGGFPPAYEIIFTGAHLRTFVFNDISKRPIAQFVCALKGHLSLSFEKQLFNCRKFPTVL
jgi:hypothetical protein